MVLSAFGTPCLSSYLKVISEILVWTFYSRRLLQNDFCNPSKLYLIIISALTHVWTSFCCKCAFSGWSTLFCLSWFSCFHLVLFSLCLGRLWKGASSSLIYDWLNVTDSFFILAQVAGRFKQKLRSLQKKDGPVKKVSLNDFVIKVRFLTAFNSCTQLIICITHQFLIALNVQAAALALKKVPEVNSSWNEEYIRQ